MAENTHAFVQYYSDKSTDIVEIGQFENCNVVTGKKAQVKWFNDQTKKNEHYTAYIHFLGTSEADIERQIQEFEDTGNRLKLPTSRTVLSLGGNVSDDDLHLKEKKAKISAAKTRVKDEILNEYYKNNTLLKDRKKLSLDDEIEEETEREDNEKSNTQEDNIQKSKEISLDSHHEPANSKRLKVNHPVITSNVLISCGNNAIPGTSKHKNKESIMSQDKNPQSEVGQKKNEVLAMRQGENADSGISRNINPELEMDHRENAEHAIGQDENEEPRINQNANAEHQINGRPHAVRRIKLNKYDVYNNQTYLGGGIMILTEDWNDIKRSRSNGCFIINLALCIWGDDLKNMCLDETRAGPRDEEQVQVRTQIPNKMIRAMEEVYKDRLIKQGAKGQKKLKELVGRVRKTLTSKINDLNKPKNRRERIPDDESDEEDGLVEE
ncbi:uncharacterized protein LOC127291280 [Leptopilina boulardi]|uniref:uncharacterized protein LOC127287220 n=1 Tax=Leptopilina boulardi TaxID=63433 RepID=UPI0021F537B2|nr:uncharacterized protein LOC127278031 isoform X1 [Leptopilina boulardi]XP_051170001.1 uncharacterized protein LOC127287220 [Leptopilina boulardi]XP_051176289.1 uncharacterized protein LOC127291280 [Leptopilina boulardi]